MAHWRLRKASPIRPLGFLPLIALLLAGSALAQCDLIKIFPAAGELNDGFGGAVALEGDLAVLGARTAPGPYGPGRAYVHDAATGALLHELSGSGLDDLDYFGHSVAVAGGLVIVGAPFWAEGAGSAHVFDTQTGQELFFLQPDDPLAGAGFGEAVALWGGMAVVGSPRAVVANKPRGAVYLFDLSTGQQRRKIAASDGQKDDFFGSGLACSDDRLLVGAVGVDDKGDAAGAAYLLDLAAKTELFKFTASDGATADNFGGSLDLDHRYALVGAAGNNLGGYDEGAAYLYDVSTGQELHRLVSADPQAAEMVGSGVALGVDVAYAGAIFRNDGITKAGAVHVFELQTGAALYRFASPEPQHSALLGYVAWSAGRLLVGAPRQDGAAADSGAAFLGTDDACALGASFCIATSNSTGRAASIRAEGSTSLARDEFALVASHVPAFQSGVFLASVTADFVPSFAGGQGNLCLGAPLQRLNLGPLNSGAAGRLATQVDLKLVPGVVVPGDTWRFQGWFRDGATSNTTDGVVLTFD